MDVSGLWSFLYSINIQMRQITATNHLCFGEKSLLLCGSTFLKKKKSFFPVWDLVATGEQIEKKLFCHWKNTLKLWRTWPLALPVHNILSHLHFFKVGEIMLKYGNLILPAGHILDLYCVCLSSDAPFCENYTKLFFVYFDAKGLNKGAGKIFGALFSKKVPFLANIERCPNFLEYALTRGISR